MEKIEGNKGTREQGNMNLLGNGGGNKKRTTGEELRAGVGGKQIC